jgi:2-polyprenyl-6-methoxyphenol hydroxylase-like FAD-dependent oxidoreductase
MSDRIGHTAVVIGAGIGGLSAAAALSPHFSRVVVLERDDLPNVPGLRAGIPQGRHAHVLLAGGLHALNALLPGFERDLASAGAVRYQEGVDVRVERPGFDPFPQRDLGWHTYSMSRPLMEAVARQCVGRLPNVSLQPRCAVHTLVADADGSAVSGVQLSDGQAEATMLACDLVVDASGRAEPTRALLQSLEQVVPRESRIGIDVHYATAVFEMPINHAEAWKVVSAFPEPKSGSLGALLVPIEGDRWMISMGASHGESLPADKDGFMQALRRLRNPTIHDAVSGAKMIDKPVRYAFEASVRRHFNELTAMPNRLFPLGDAVCRVNPLYGQGMSVAAMQALGLRKLLDNRAGKGLNDLANDYFAMMEEVIDAPWSVAELDFMYPETTGERPASFAFTLAYLRALLQVAARDPQAHRALMAVRHLLKPTSTYREPWLMQQVMAQMASDQPEGLTVG